MAKTGKIAEIDLSAVATEAAWPRRTGLRQRLLCGLSAIAFFGAVSLPVTIDPGSLAPELATAQAVGNGQGSGNGDGQGKGKGNGKGQGDENGGPRDWGDDDDQGDDDDHGDDDDGSEHSADDRSDNDSGELGEADEAMATEAVADAGQSPADAIGEPPAAALPTVKQVFSLGEDSVLSAEQELLAIKNGWNVQN